MGASFVGSNVIAYNRYDELKLRSGSFDLEIPMTITFPSPFIIAHHNLWSDSILYGDDTGQSIFRGASWGKYLLPSGKAHWLSIFGTSKDSSGSPLGGVNVHCFRTVDNVFMSETISLADGSYEIRVPNGDQYYLVEYKAGSPDVAGTSLNTLTGA